LGCVPRPRCPLPVAVKRPKVRAKLDQDLLGVRCGALHMKTCDTCKHHAQFRGQRMECNAVRGHWVKAETMRETKAPCGPEGRLWVPATTEKEEKNV